MSVCNSTPLGELSEAHTKKSVLAGKSPDSIIAVEFFDNPRKRLTVNQANPLRKNVISIVHEIPLWGP
jgi:hypothetical protein